MVKLSFTKQVCVNNYGLNLVKELHVLVNISGGSLKAGGYYIWCLCCIVLQLHLL